MNAIQALRAIQEIKGTNAKLVLLKELKDVPNLDDVFYMACSNDNFFHKKPFTGKGNPDVSLDEGVDIVITLLDDLRKRRITGTNTRIDAINAALEGAHPEAIELFNRVIKKSLKCSLGESAANEIWGEGFIPHFPVMLVDPHSNKAAAKIMQSKSGAVMQLKSDGVRCIVNGIGDSHDDYTFKSRQGEVFYGLKEVFAKAIAEALDNTFWDLGPSKFGVDGEMCVVENGVHNFSKANGIMQKCQEGTATEAEINSLTYIVWDLYFVGDDETYEDRLFNLEDFVGNMPCTLCEMCPTWRVSSLEEVHTKFAEIVKTGNEGVVLKSLDNIWSDSRVSDMIKYKEKHRVSMRVTGFYLGDAGDKYQNVLGGLSIESADGLVACNTGSGIKDNQRGILYENGKPVKDDKGHFVADPDFDLEQYVDAIVEIEYNQRTRSKTSTENDPFSLRFPIVKALPRTDKTEADTLEWMIREEEGSYGLRTSE